MLSALSARGDSKPLVILPLGDSLTAGGYNENGVFKTGAGYRFALWKKLKATHQKIAFAGSKQDGPANFPDRHHEGHSGRRTDEITVNALPAIKTAKADIVLLMVGTNDILQNHDLSRETQNLAALVNEVEKYNPHAKILISTIIPNSNPTAQQRVIQYNQVLTQWVKNRERFDIKIRLVDMYRDAHLRNGSDGKPSDLIDGTHPTPAGYEAMGSVWYTAIRNLQQADLQGAIQTQQTINSTLKEILNPSSVSKSCN